MAMPSLGKVVFKESDVTGPAGLKPNDAYDLTLYEDGADSKKGILVVSMTLQMMFKNGVSKSSGKELKWDHTSRNQYLQDYKKSLASIWNDKWTIATANTSAAIKETKVFFNVSTIVRNWYLGEHWELEITKTDEFRRSWVNPFWGTSDHDSGDVQPANKGAGLKPGCSGPSNVCTITQRGSVHEFGHMLGLRDEYEAAKANLSWKTDGASVMHSGEEVRPRHYSIFADWLTKQYEPVSRLAGEKIEWKVDGKWDLKNSKL